MARDGRVGAGRLVGGVHAQATPQLNARADIPRSVDRIHPQALARRVSDMASATAVCVDTGEVTLWTGNWLRPTGQQTITGSFNNAAVGTALGIANGVQALDRRRQVIVMCGDGGFGMLMQEFATSVQHKLPVKVVVFNNAGWGLVHLEMEEAGLPAFKSGVGMRNPDFAMFAEACGGTGFRVTKPQDLRDTLARALATDGPVVIDVAVDPTEIPTMPSRTGHRLEVRARQGARAVLELNTCLRGSCGGLVRQCFARCLLPLSRNPHSLRHISNHGTAMATDSQTGLAGKTRAIDRMAQERGSPGRDTVGGDATTADVETTSSRRKDVASDQPATVVTPLDGI